MSKIAIKLAADSQLSKYIIPLRKYTGLGISEIKSKIENNDLLAASDANNIDDMESLKSLVDILMKLGTEVKIFDSDKYGEGIFEYQEISYDEFTNNIERLKEISEELQDYDDAISDEIQPRNN
ncbi:hypothetical protein P9695_06380 [Weizmannia sp. CD-2023]|jgi:hypothetical protein|uniref:hypothetical protein n=1 Tax=Heyndrickxia TaxID=2837504 RepID=UPI001459F264|nr:MULTISPECIES: hypothetical protein [Heyndrickxia]MED4839960.1 hypothetical protein [Weizmannia sp. CD-2023]MED4902480.1 hypothetical protein [Weizmannia sp. CD-2023]MED4902874.1 hypothetical protein [Weizmannia sp. CD-2023]NMH83161.1 hypothetical protein [Heyndrickxia coagulans]